jgi:uncharacterized membrane protein YtjA (UPF0391 family)
MTGAVEFVVRRKGENMLYYTVLFLVIAAIAGLLGFGGVAFAATGIAKTFFFIFIAMFLISLVAHLSRGDGSGTETYGP